MDGARGLNDRIHARMAASDHPWTAEELGQEFLKLRGGSAVLLVRALLHLDPRFAEDAPGVWTARRTAVAVPLRARSLAVAWVQTTERSRPDTWRVYLRPIGEPEGGGAAHPIDALAPSDPVRWDAAFRALGPRRIATLQPGPFGRIRQWMGRRWALGGDEEPILDLHSLARLAVIHDGVPPGESAAAAGLPGLFARWGLGPIREEPEGVPLPAVEMLLDHLLERYGDVAEEELARRMDEALSPRPVPTDRFDFALRDLDQVPEDSGIYRFIGDEGVLLYVGKAVSLRRRLTSYFRPLPPEPTKREELLRAIRRFEFMPLPSELEALLRESRAIRELRPPWNVQVEVHELETWPPGWWWPLVFLAPGADPARASILLLSNPRTGFLFHLSRGADAAPPEPLVAWLDRILADEEPRRADSELGVLELDEAEVRLAVRFYLRERDRMERVDAVDLTDGQALADALQRLASGAAGNL